MENIICPECGTENEPQYNYCKNCGNYLYYQNDPFAQGGTFAKQEQPNSYYFYQGQSAQHDSTYTNTQQCYANDDMTETTIGGIPESEISLFIGSKARGMVGKMSNMERRNSKVSWCWPTAILSIIFGPCGAALWYLYRKMYKVGWAFMGIGATLTLISALIIGDITVDISAFLASDTLLYDFSSADMIGILRWYFGNLIISASTIASTVVSGLLTYGWYKRFIIKKIMKYRSTASDSKYYRFGLASVGGTSGGMLILGMIVFSVVYAVTYYIPYFTVYI